MNRQLEAAIAGGNVPIANAESNSRSTWLSHTGIHASEPLDGPTARHPHRAYRSPATAPLPELDTGAPKAEEALLVRLSAQKLWAEGRANPVSWACRSWIGDWRTGDRITWHTTDGVWLAQLQRSANGRHVFLCLWHEHSFIGYQDDVGWHAATSRSRSRQPRPLQRSLPLPLPLAG